MNILCLFIKTLGLYLLNVDMHHWPSQNPEAHYTVLAAGLNRSLPEPCRQIAATQKKWLRFQNEERADEWQNEHMCNNIRRNFQKHCKKAGIITDEKLTTHTLRKSYAQTMSSHVDIWTLKKLMGHSSIRVLEQFYLHKTTPNEQQACDVMEELFREWI